MKRPTSNLVVLLVVPVVKRPQLQLPSHPAPSRLIPPYSTTSKGCPVHILTARAKWRDGERTTNSWLELNGILYHSLKLVSSAADKVAILARACIAETPCIFVDDLRSGWSTAPVGLKVIKGDDVVLMG